MRRDRSARPSGEIFFRSNLPLLAEAGFNNPIMAATMACLCAHWLLSSRSSSSPFWAGVLIPLAVFLRMAFFPTVIVSLYLATMLHGRRCLIVHVAGLATRRMVPGS